MSWWVHFAERRRGTEIEIPSNDAFGSDGSQAIERKYKWYNNGGSLLKCRDCRMLETFV